MQVQFSGLIPLLCLLLLSFFPATGCSEKVPQPEMVRIEAGSFRMGSDSAEADEAPVHTVELSRNYFIGTTEVTRGEYLLFCENTGGDPLSVASLPPNSRGLYDMVGNSFEWCWDWYDAEYYQHSPTRDPAGPELPGNVNTPRGPEKARRSGSWRENGDSVLSYSRSYDNIYYAGDNGFRLVRTAP